MTEDDLREAIRAGDPLKDWKPELATGEQIGVRGAGPVGVHHYGHPERDGVTDCGIPMPEEQMQVRSRTGRPRICEACIEAKQARGGR